MNALVTLDPMPDTRKLLREMIPPQTADVPTEKAGREQSKRPVSEPVLEEARRLVKQHFAKCFWFRHPDATVETWEDAYLVVEHLREYGGHREWHEAQSLWKALRSCH